MDLASAVLSGTSSFLPKLPTSVSTPHVASLPLCRNPARNPCFKLRGLKKFSGGQFSVYKPSLQHLPRATAGNTASLPHKQEDLSASDGPGSSVHVDSSTETVNETKDEASGSRSWSEEEMTRVCDKLIGTFTVDKPTPNDWRKLLAFSRTWDVIRPHFFRRCQERAESLDDPAMKHQLLRFSRRLKEVDQDVQRHTELLEVVKRAPSEIHEVVTRRRKDFTQEFFVHVHNVAESYYDKPSEQDAIAKLRDMCWDAVRAYDTASKDIEALNAAELKLQDILNSRTVNDACSKIDDLAAKNQLDSALALMITKAWSDAKESTLVKDEAKDIMYHLYKTTVANMQRQVPKDVRILKYLLMIEDPLERVSVLKDAFTPGEELEGKEVDALYTTPQELHALIKTILAAYYQSKVGTLMKEARDLMNPKIIAKMEDIKKVIEAQYL